MEDEIESCRSTITMLQEQAGVRKRTGKYLLLRQPHPLTGVIGAGKEAKNGSATTGDDE